MKTLILSVLAVSALAFAHPAQAFWCGAPAYVGGMQAWAQVTNYYGMPVVCQVQVAAQRNDGFVQTAWSQLYILPGQFEYAYVYTAYPFFFIGAQAQADCEYAYY